MRLCFLRPTMRSPSLSTFFRGPPFFLDYFTPSESNCPFFRLGFPVVSALCPLPSSDFFSGKLRRLPVPRFHPQPIRNSFFTFQPQVPIVPFLFLLVCWAGMGVVRFSKGCRLHKALYFTLNPHRFPAFPPPPSGPPIRPLHSFLPLQAVPSSSLLYVFIRSWPSLPPFFYTF